MKKVLLMTLLLGAALGVGAQGLNYGLLNLRSPDILEEVADQVVYRAGEFARIDTNFMNQAEMRWFDGVTVGGWRVPKQLKRDIYVIPAEDATKGERGNNLKLAIAKANEMAEVEVEDGYYAYNPVRVLVAPGQYSVTNGVDVNYGVDLISMVSAQGVGQSMEVEIGGLTSPFNRPWPSVYIQMVGTNDLIRYSKAGLSTKSPLHLKGLRISGNIGMDLTVPANVSALIEGCIVDGTVASNSVTDVSGTPSVSITAYRSIFGGQIFSDHAADKCFMEAFSCHFTKDSFMHANQMNPSYNAPAYDKEWRNCEILNPDFFRAGLGGFTCALPRLVNCEIAGNGFLASAPPDYTFGGEFYQCRFIGTAGTWAPNMSQANKDAFKFFGCDGVNQAFVTANPSMSVQHCSNESGGAIPNQ